MTIIPDIEDDLELAKQVIKEVEVHKVVQRLPLRWTYRLALKTIEQQKQIEKLERGIVEARRETYL
jgi:hypothetical protein